MKFLADANMEQPQEHKNLFALWAAAKVAYDVDSEDTTKMDADTMRQEAANLERAILTVDADWQSFKKHVLADFIKIK